VRAGNDGMALTARPLQQNRVNISIVSQ